MSGDFSTENTVIILDCSRSVRRTDFSPTRYHLALNALHSFIKFKHAIDPKDTFALILFGKEHPDSKVGAEVIFSLQSNPDSLLKTISAKNFTRQHPPRGRSVPLAAALNTSVDLLGGKIRSIGGQVSRILFITDNCRFQLTDPLIEQVKVAEGLNIFIDICVFHKQVIPLEREAYQFLTNTTGGELGEFFSSKALIRGMEGFASKKIHDDSALLLGSREKEDGTYFADIALALRLPNQEELAKITDFKCQICFSPRSALNRTTFNQTGRFCPYCDTPLHLHCAGLWAIKSEVAPNIFRCPHCYTLLKISPVIIRGLESRKIGGKIKGNGIKLKVKMIRVKSPEFISDQTDFCQKCFHVITSQDVKNTKNKIFRCSHCNALYHVACLEKMYKKSKICLNCAGKII